MAATTSTRASPSSSRSRGSRTSDDGAFEPDAGFYLDPEAERAVRRVEGYLDARTGLPPPDLVVEIDRSRRSRRKLAPYFRMGVKEAWTWDRKEGASLWQPHAAERDGFRAVAESRVCPGLTRDDLDRLCALGVPAVERARLSRRLARRIAERLAPTLPFLATGAWEPAPRSGTPVPLQSSSGLIRRTDGK